MNDIEKAIETMNYIKTSVGVFGQEEDIDLAISALEKQLNGGWIPFETEYDEDYDMNMLQGKIPDDEQEIFVTDGESVWSDTFMRDGIECYLDSGNSLVDKVIAWQPLPPAYKEADNE